MNRIVSRDGTWHRRNGTNGSGVGILPWTPAATTTASWYDADDASTITSSSGAISEWKDKSGNSRDASQSTGSLQPSLVTNDLNGRNTISFDGDWLSHTYVPTATSFSIYVVCNVNFLAANYSYLYQTGSNDNTGSNLVTRFFPTGGDTTNAFGYYGTVGGTGTSFRYAGNVVMGMGWLMIGMTRTTGGTFYLNGSSDGTFATDSRGTTTGTIGGTTSSTYYSGKIAEIVVFDSSISSTIRQQLEGYLAHKWGLNRLLPYTHPYKYLVPS